jgi:hypothetical protein
MIRKFFLNVVAVHIKDLRRTPYAYFTKFSRVNVPLNDDLSFWISFGNIYLFFSAFYTSLAYT